MTVAQFVNEARAVVSVDASDSVAEVVAVLGSRRIGCVPVLEDGRVAGIFSERDVIYGLAERGADLLGLKVGEVMTTPPLTIETDTPVLSALSLMTRRRVRHLPIVDGAGAMIGFISIGDLVKSRIDRIEAEADAMRDYIRSA